MGLGTAEGCGEHWRRALLGRNWKEPAGNQFVLRVTGILLPQMCMKEQVTEGNCCEERACAAL